MLLSAAAVKKFQCRDPRKNACPQKSAMTLPRA
jgi:hypothetical protein